MGESQCAAFAVPIVEKEPDSRVSIGVASVGETIWVLGIIAWYVIRYPFERRAHRVRVVSDRRSRSDAVGLASALFGMAILPGFYVATGIPGVGDYPARAWA